MFTLCQNTSKPVLLKPTYAVVKRWVPILGLQALRLFIGDLFGEGIFNESILKAVRRLTPVVHHGAELVFSRVELCRSPHRDRWAEDHWKTISVICLLASKIWNIGNLRPTICKSWC